MHFATTAVSVTLALAGVAAAQSASDIPSCAVGCFAQAIGETNCGLTDYECQCTTGQETISESLVPCLCQSSCTSDDYDEINTVITAICNSATDDFTANELSSDSCSSSGGSSSSSDDSGSSATATASAMSSMSMDMASNMTSSMGSMSATASTASASIAQQTTNAASKFGTDAAMVGLAGLAVIAL